jgi:UDP-N-acetylmuramate dehydrogenase
MASRTTFQVGGNVRYLLEPTTERELADALRWVRAKGLELFAMGRGSNLVVSDKGWPGAVVAISGGFSGVDWAEPRATAFAGTRLTDLVVQAVGRGLAGIERLAGIPGTVGGAVAINAGAYGQEFGERAISVRSMDLDGTVRERTREECGFGYRTSVFRGCREIVLSAELELAHGDPEDLKRIVRDTQKARLDKQPLNLPNAGSLFKRPSGGFASKMVEEAGLKGFRVGKRRHLREARGVRGQPGRGHRAGRVEPLVRSRSAGCASSTAWTLEREVVFLGDFDSTGSAS